MKICVRCGVSGDIVRLFDAIYEGRMGSICERCSIIENIPIIKKPNASQLKESEKGIRVYDRMRRLAGMREIKKEDTFFPEDKLGELEKHPELELPEKRQLNLIDFFHWEVMKNRRRKGLTQKQLAETLGESEVAISMIEKAKLPEGAERIIRKLEQFLQIRLRKFSEVEKILEERKKFEKPVLLDKDGMELEVIPEPELDEIKIKESERDLEEEAEEISEKKQQLNTGKKELEKLGETRDLDLKKANLSNLTIKDLKELHKKRIEATRQERIEEQKKIEERQRLIEAKKEELRLLKEKESKELDKYLGGTELIGRDKKRKDIDNSENIDEFNKELI